MTTNPIRQCIKTRYFGPTNTKPSGIKATAERGSVRIHWDGSLGVDGNHRAAVAALLAKFRQEDGHPDNGWGDVTEWVGGADSIEHVWVHAPGLASAAAKEEANA